VSIVTAYWTERARISLRTDLVLELVDNLTQQLVQPCQLKFNINDRLVKPTKNKNGLIIFCNIPDPFESVKIESDLYQSAVVDLTSEEVQQFQQGHFVHRLVRLEPSLRYSMPKWATVVQGQFQNEDMNEIIKAEYGAVIGSSSETYRLKREMETGNAVSVHITSPQIMLGRTFFEAEGHPRDAFKLVEKKDDGFVVSPNLEKPLEAHSLLSEFKSFKVCDDGRFMLVLPRFDSERTAIKLYRNNEKIGEFQVSAGKWNDIGVLMIEN